MYSSTVSPPSTVRIVSDSDRVTELFQSATSLPVQTACFQTLEDHMPQKLCDEYLQRHLSPRSEKPANLIQTGCTICEKSAEALEQTIDKWAEKAFDRNCYSLEFTREKYKKRINRIEKVSHRFVKEPKPWNALKEPKGLVENPMLRKYYSFPKIAVQLELGFADYRKIAEYASHGINMFIVNLQYGTRTKHKRTFDSIEKAIRRIERNMYLDCEIAVMAEITAPCLKTGLLNHNMPDVYLDRDSRILLTADRRFSHKGSQEVIYVNFGNYIRWIQRGDRIKIGDKIEVEAIDVLVKTLVCIVKKAGLLKAQMKVTVPKERNPIGNYISIEQEEDIKFLLERNSCDYVICPCAHDINMCQYIRWFMATNQRRMFIIGRIQPDMYFDQDVIARIVHEFTGIWLDESRIDREPSEIEKLIVRLSLRDRKPLMRSAHYIDSEHLKLPKNRDILRNLLAYPDCLVVSSCMAGGLSPLDVRSVIRRNYPEMNFETLEYNCTFIPRMDHATHALIRQVALNVIFEKVVCIIMINNTGQSVMLMASNRVTVPIVATLRDETIVRRLLLYRNVIPLIYYENGACKWHEELNDRINYSLEYAKRNNFIDKDDVFIVCFDSRRGIKYADSYRFATLNCE